MPSYDEIIHISAAAEARELAGEKSKPKTSLDYFALAVTTFGVGYLPLMPGTYGSAVGVGIYLLFANLKKALICITETAQTARTSRLGFTFLI
jgi:hypothetical protein